MTSALALLAACAVGCSGPGNGDAGTEDVNLSDAATDGTNPSDVHHNGDGGLPPLDVVTSDAPGLITGACSTIMNIAPSINETTASGPMPRGSGGMVARGWYFLTASTRYGGDGGPAGGADGSADATSGADATTADAAADAATTDGAPRIDAAGTGGARQSSMLIAGSAAFVITRVETTTTTATYQLDESGPSAVFTPVCPAMNPPAIDSYDATGTQLVLYRVAEQRVDTYTRQ